jgi:hypothetical protein
MGTNTLKAFIKEVLSEQEHDARVPQQLISPEDASNSEESDNADECDMTTGLDEFSGAGAVAGMTLPLGMSPSNTTRKSQKRTSRK